MEGLVKHTGTIVVYNEDDIDTDRIIPARYLSRVSRSGYGELLFSDVRGDDFPLDQDIARGATILVSGTNFGCGSSREHAVWAIQQAGFRVVIARQDSDSPGYSDIFRQNAANCGLLLVELPSSSHASIVGLGTGATVMIDLAEQTVVFDNEVHSFEINPVVKEQIMAGLDLIGTTLVSTQEIASFEQAWHSFSPKVEAGQ